MQHVSSNWTTVSSQTIRRRALCASASMAILGLALGGGSAAHAAEEAPYAANPAETVGLEEVVVTARRRTERLQDVPVSATVISGETLRAQGAINTRDVLATVPSLTVSTGSRGTRDAVIKIRGVATADTSPVFDPGVGVYVNDVYIGRTAGGLTDLVDLESVQVLRGPQGTLFGRNSVGGAVLLTTRRPVNEFEGEVGARVGNYKGFGGHAIVNLPLSEVWAARAVYQQYSREGYGDNLFTGFDNLNNSRNETWRVSLLGRPLDNVEVFLSYDGADEKSNGRAATPIGTLAAVNSTYATATALGVVANPSLLPAPGSLGPHETLGFISGGVDNTRFDNYTAQLGWEVSDELDLSLTAGYRKVRNKSTTDQDGTPAPIANASMPNHQQQRFVEVKANGAGMGSKLDWVVGANFFNEQGGLEVLTNPERATTRSDSLSFIQNESYAAFAHASFDLTDRLSLAGGVRKTYDQRKIQTAAYRGAANTLATCIVNVSLRAPGGCEARAAAKFDYFSWEAAADYEVTDSVNVYVRASKGQKSGGFNASVQTGFLNPFNPERLLQYEAGVKAELFDNRVRIDADVYTGDYEELQRQVVRIIRGAPSVFVSNASKATVNGAELEVSIAPVDHLLIRGGVGYTDASYDVWQFIDPVTGSRENLSSNKFALVPKYTYSLSAQYTVPVGSGDLSFSAVLNGNSSYFLSPENRLDFKQKNFALLSGRLSYTPEDKNWEVAIFASNITDEYYHTFGSVYGLPAGPLLVPVSGAPRMVGASLTYRFN